MKPICIIPARGGSKGVPRKNIRPLLNKPLIAYTIEKSLESDIFSHVIVSTEDKEISKVIVKDLKEFSKKIQSSIQDQSIRVSSKKRDELQDAISYLKEKNYKVFLNYGNFRD